VGNVTIGPDGNYELNGTDRPQPRKLLRTVEDLIECLKTDPRRIAEAMQRIGRFGGQVPAANVLRHTLDVWQRVCDGAKSKAAIRWALLHDVHEVLTGDVVHGHKPIWLSNRQDEIDRALIAEFLPGLTQQQRGYVGFCDYYCGNAELARWERDEHEEWFCDVTTWVREVQKFCR
jgi:hypothetical protein